VTRLFRRFIDLLEWWAVFLLVLMVIVVCLGVFFRYVLNAALVWYDEFAAYILVWLTFYGAVVASYHGRHIGFDVVVEGLNPNSKKVVEAVAECFVLGFQVILLYYGWLLTRRMGDETAVSLVWVRMGWIYSALPITGGLMLLISAGRLLRLLSGKKEEKGTIAAWSGSSSE